MAGVGTRRSYGIALKLIPEQRRIAVYLVTNYIQTTHVIR